MQSPKKINKKQNGLKLQNVEAITNNQKDFFRRYEFYDVVSLSGFPGTGKTYISLYKALQDIEQNKFDECIIIRSAVASRAIGFLPGNEKEKMAVYEQPYVSICSKLYGRADAYEILKKHGIIRFESSSFLRGETFENTVIIVDEAQNLSWIELFTILTRLGEGSKMIICGDEMQDDLTSKRYNEESGYGKMLDVLDRIPTHCYQINFTEDDIVRSGFVKSLILAISQSQIV